MTDAFWAFLILAGFGVLAITAITALWFRVSELRRRVSDLEAEDRAASAR